MLYPLLDLYIPLYIRKYNNFSSFETNGAPYYAIAQMTPCKPVCLYSHVHACTCSYSQPAIADKSAYNNPGTDTDIA